MESFAVARPAMLVLLLWVSACTRAPEHPDFSGVWQVADPDAVVRPEVTAGESDYTPQAWKNLQDFRANWRRETDDPAKFCVRQGMPNTMTTRARDYVYDIQQSAGRITVLVELFDNYRVIHLDEQAPPAAVLPSNNGYSIGRWQGDTLAVVTTHLKARPAVSNVQRSAAAQISERWTLKRDVANAEVIEVDMTVLDPEVYSHAVRAFQKLKRAPAGTVINEYGCADALWEDYVASHPPAGP